LQKAKNRRSNVGGATYVEYEEVDVIGGSSARAIGGG
jgi:hypothetical protein